MSAPPPHPVNGAAPPGWYADPAGAGTRYWDGVTWNETAAPYQRAPGGARRPPRRRRAVIIVAAASFALVVLVGGCIAVSARSKASFETDAAALADRLLQPADLDGTWEERDLGAPPPVGPPLSRSAHRVGHVCPDAREALTGALVDSGELVGRGSAAVAETVLTRSATETDSGAGVVQEGIVAYWLGADADTAFDAYRRARTCDETWEYTAPDDSRWQVRNEPLNARPFGPNIVVARTTFTPVDADGPGGEPVPTDLETTYLNVVSRDDDRILLLSTTGLSIEETVTVYDEALAKLVP